jgi:hypothetical protein
VGSNLMDADWSVQLAADDDALEFPWSSPDGPQRYIDLLRHPEQLREIPEAVQFPELGDFLLALNSPPSPWLSAKCDVWIDHDLDEAEAIYNAKLKLGSYVDLIFRADDARFSFDRHEHWVKLAARELSSDDDLPLACEFIVRRCWYHPEVSPLREFDDTSSIEGESPLPGFYITLYLFGYGNDEPQARSHWAEGLRRVTAVLARLSL